MLGGFVTLPRFLRDALEERDTIVLLEVLHVQDELLTRSALGPARLESIAQVRSKIDDPAVIENVLTYIDETSMDEEPGDLDARWGLIFTNAKGQRVLSFYLDKFGARGAAEGYEIRLHNADRIVDLLKTVIPPP
jgi:hypothetical protein